MACSLQNKVKRPKTTSRQKESKTVDCKKSKSRMSMFQGNQDDEFRKYDYFVNEPLLTKN